MKKLDNQQYYIQYDMFKEKARIKIMFLNQVWLINKPQLIHINQEQNGYIIQRKRSIQYSNQELQCEYVTLLSPDFIEKQNDIKIYEQSLRQIQFKQAIYINREEEFYIKINQIQLLSYPQVILNTQFASFSASNKNIESTLIGNCNLKSAESDDYSCNIQLYNLQPFRQRNYVSSCYRARWTRKGIISFRLEEWNKKTKQGYSMKIMQKANITGKRSVQSFMNELQLLGAAFQDRDDLYQVMFLLNSGDLQYHTHKQRRFTEEQTKYFAACIKIHPL
ncbi:hypothetical protein pb186bvf_018781 [Paramecium bursaria]